MTTNGRPRRGRGAPRTRATYAADWALFTDWCAATGHRALPADPATVLEFLADCPAAPATQRRRVIAIDHHHTAAGHPPPGADPRVRDALGRPPTELPPIAPEIRTRVDAALRLLPSRGWTGGMFGRRDRCLLVLSQLARIPHQHLASLTAGDITVADGVATITVGRPDQNRGGGGGSGAVRALRDRPLAAHPRRDRHQDRHPRRSPTTSDKATSLTSAVDRTCAANRSRSTTGRPSIRCWPRSTSGDTLRSR